MSTHLITGFAGKEHITSADQGSFNAAVMGGGEFVLERGEQFRCQVVSNNKVRIYDGDALMQGRHIIIDRNTYEETTHDNGTQGYKRIDLIVLTYEKNAVSSVESVKLEVIKGSPSESDPAVPEYTTGDILNSGAAKNQMPLYQIPFDGLSIGEPVKLFSTVTTLETMKKEVDDEVDAKKEELDEKFKSMITSNAEDWGMIENYGEYTADAKTVGEEFAKVNECLVGFIGETETVLFPPNEGSEWSWVDSFDETYTATENCFVYLNIGYPNNTSVPVVWTVSIDNIVVGGCFRNSSAYAGYDRQLLPLKKGQKLRIWNDSRYSPGKWYIGYCTKINMV